MVDAEANMSKESNIIDSLKLDDLDPDDRENVKSSLKLFTKYLTTDKSLAPQIWLQAVNKVINKFPKYCMSLRNVFEKYLTQFIDKTDFLVVLRAAQCMLALQQVRPQEQKDASPKSNWKDHIESLCEAGTLLVDIVFSEQANKLRYSQQENVTATSLYAKSLLNTSRSTSSENITKLKQRLCNVLIHIQVMLVDPFPSAKSVSPKNILALVASAIYESCADNTNLDVEAIKDIKIQALRLIDALVVCLHTNLIPYTRLIIKLLTNALDWSKEVKDEARTTVRIKAYDSVKQFLTMLRCYVPVTSGDFNFESLFIKHILMDITTDKPTVQLQATGISKKSKKAKRRMAQAILAQSNLAARVQGIHDQPTIPETNEDLYIAALNCAETFVLVCGLFIKSEHYQALMQVIVTECFKCEDYSEEIAFSLCSVLEALRRSSPPTAASTTNYNLQLFSMLSSSRYPKISDLATKALLDISIYLHYSPPSLSCQNVFQPVNMSKNRDALQEFLGEKRFNEVMELRNNDLEFEEIDRPNNKRARTYSELNVVNINEDARDSVDEVITFDTDTRNNIDNMESNDLNSDQIISDQNNAMDSEFSQIRTNNEKSEEDSTVVELNSNVDENNLPALDNGVDFIDSSAHLTNINNTEEPKTMDQFNGTNGFQCDQNNSDRSSDLSSMVVGSNNIDNESKLETQELKTTFTAIFNELEENATITVSRENITSNSITNMTMTVPNTEELSVAEMLNDFVGE